MSVAMHIKEKQGVFHVDKQVRTQVAHSLMHVVRMLENRWNPELSFVGKRKDLGAVWGDSRANPHQTFF